MDTGLSAAIGDFVSGMNYRIWGVRWHNQGRSRYLQVFIDHDDGIDVDDCARVSRALSIWLDVEMSQVNEYVLEVSSPGVDRLLFGFSHFDLYRGYTVILRLHRAVAGRKKLAAVIVDCDEYAVVIDCDSEQFSIPLKDIKEARLEPQIAVPRRVQHQR